ncbi:hypothetical protein HZC08_01770, partial [Candidatus Micrarchaeota archaeon]|nr:hypothetical protein [Candidatus Micrarchaeota archaeon]
MEIKNAFELGKYFTYELTKEKPVYNWFYYKEGFAPEIVDFMVQGNTARQKILDLFCGSGTTLLRAKELGFESVGIDSSPLSVFVSRVKTQNYEEKDLAEAEEFLKSVHKLNEERFNWKFELFNPKNAFPFSNFNKILNLRGSIQKVENENVRDLLLLALVSIIPQTSLVIKDGGVLKIDKRKRAMPVKEAFKRKTKRIIGELGANSRGPIPKVGLGDARQMELENESVNLIVTSPPYLNNIDYSKVYGLEL